MTPALLTTTEVRNWLLGLGRQRVRLPRTPERHLFVSTQNPAECWRVRVAVGVPGCYFVEPVSADWLKDQK